MIENDLSLEHRKKINDFITLKSKDTLWSKFVLMLGIQMKTGLDPKIIVSIENKTYLDKTMLEGSIATASKIKSGNPYCLFFIVCETYEVGKQVDPQYTDIDQIYSLRKSDKRGSRDPLQAEIVLDLFNKVKNHLDSDWSNVSENIKSGKILQ